MTTTLGAWRNRIVGHADVPPYAPSLPGATGEPLTLDVRRWPSGGTHVALDWRAR